MSASGAALIGDLNASKREWRGGGIRGVVELGVAFNGVNGAAARGRRGRGRREGVGGWILIQRREMIGDVCVYGPSDGNPTVIRGEGGIVRRLGPRVRA